MSEQHYKDAWSNTLDHYNADTLKWQNEKTEMYYKIQQLEHDSRLLAEEVIKLHENCEGDPCRCDPAMWQLAGKVLKT